MRLVTFFKKRKYSEQKDVTMKTASRCQTEYEIQPQTARMSVPSWDTMTQENDKNLT